MPHCKPIKLGDVWRTCNKIRAAVFRMGINLFDYFLPLDPHKNCLISESQFISVINGQLRAIIGLSEQEVAELADYFRIPDGRIYYTQLCEVIHDSVPQFSKNAPLVTGLEWEDPMHMNRLSKSEERRISVLMTKIASAVNMRKIILRPYFQDYELVSKNSGTITLAHFARILAYLEILLSADDFSLLVKKYIKDSYTVNYIAFITTISNIMNCLNAYGIVDLSGDFDGFNCGRITTSQFIRGLDALVLAGRQKFFLSQPDILAIIHQYMDPLDRTRVCWRTFEDDIESVFTVKELEKMPSLVVESPPQAVKDLPKLGGKDWQTVNTKSRELCEQAVDKVKQKIIHRRILLKPVFRDFDKHNNGHVSRSQMRQAFNSNGILLSDYEFAALEDRFSNDMGFNYFWFLKDVENSEQEPLYKQLSEDAAKISAGRPRQPPTRQELDIVLIMAKIKGKVVRERIRVIEFLRGFDKLNTMVITRSEFRRGLANCRFELTENELDTLCNVFASPLRKEFVDYKRFSDVVEEAFTQLCLERAPMVVPIPHLPTKDCEKNFLNFDERIKCSVALQKLASKPDLQMNLSSVLEDFDKTHSGTVPPSVFLKALNRRGMDRLISRNELDIICKCFSYEKGSKTEVDYRSFMKALDILYATEKYNPF